MKKIFIFILIHTILLSQNEINDIIIIGNKKTSKQIIIDAISHNVGDAININMIEDDKKKLSNLNLFTNVIIYPNKSTLYIIVKEKKDFSLMPLMSKDDILGWSYGIGLRFKNIKNKSHSIKIGYMTGKINSYFIEYNNEPIIEKIIQIKNILSKSNHSNFGNEYIVTRNKISTYLSFKNNISFQLELQYNELDYVDTLLADFNVREIKNTIFYNRTNFFSKNKNILKLYYSIIVGDYNYNHNINHAINLFNKYSININKHDKSPKISLKNHIIINSSSNIPDYDKNYLNSEDYVRGYPINVSENNMIISNKMKWNNIILFSLQFELPLFDVKLYKTELLLFSDFGIGSDRYNNFANKDKLRGFGVGIRFEIPKYGGADMCFGLNPYNGMKQFHFIANFTKMK